VLKTFDKFKAWLVVHGDMMQSYDFEIYAPTCAWSSTIQMVLMLALTWGWTTCTNGVIVVPEPCETALMDANCMPLEGIEVNRKRV
jgi:hypothetical protein